MKTAIVLLSGGLDSTTTLAITQEMGFSPRALTILYGQRNRVELMAAQRVAKRFKLTEHKILELDLRLIGGSSLTADMSVKAHEEVDQSSIPNTYVPARNTIMLSLALAYAEVSGADDIFFGANVHDYSGYPDCRPAYIEAFQTMANLAIKSAHEGHRIQIHAPLVNMTKADIIRRGLSLGVCYEDTHSCYDPIGDLACGKCSACHYRRKGFIDVGVPDPTRYTSRLESVTMPANPL